MSIPLAGEVIATILRHDAKLTSYKLALVRAVNDAALAFPDVAPVDGRVAIPLRLLAASWAAFYWPFVSEDAPIAQGRPAERDGLRRLDIAFRPHLTRFRARWERVTGGPADPADGFAAVGELRIPRRRATYPADLLALYDDALDAIARAIPYPIKHAGPGEWAVFPRPARIDRLPPGTVAVPGSAPSDVCLAVPAALWRTFRAMALWVDALCIHEWCLFTEATTRRAAAPAERGAIYRLLTAEPGARRPLTWERNRVRVLLLEGAAFTCPWTERTIAGDAPFDLDHLVPVALRPINELWNLVPADPRFNSHHKRDRLPSPARLARALPHLAGTYRRYTGEQDLGRALREDVALRFAALPRDPDRYPLAVADAAAGFIERLAAARNLPRFD